MNKDIVREYDIRGTYGHNLFDSDAIEIGRCFGQELNRRNEKKVIVARDGRYSSFSLFENLVKGLLESGIYVIDIGESPTPCMYFATISPYRTADSGIMITASHNPKDDNGFKFILSQKSLFGEDLKRLFNRPLDNSLNTDHGILQRISIKNKYIGRILSDFQPTSKNMKIACDLSGGAVSFIFDDIVQNLPFEFICINADNDPYFRAHTPDPSIESNLEQLIDVIKDKKCDFGIVFDGDGDRLTIIDEKGIPLPTDKLMTVFALDAKVKGRPIVGDIKLSDFYFKTLNRLGFDTIVSRTGHSYIKEMISLSNASFAAEMSGHVFFNDYFYGFDDAIYAFIRFLNIISKIDGKCSSLISEFPEIYISPETKHCFTGEKEDIINQIKKFFEQDRTLICIESIDGIKARFTNGWVLCRFSHTQNVLTSRIEGNSPEALSVLSKKAEKIIYSIL